jgi:hypothetical protein
MPVGLPRHIRDAETFENLRSRTSEFADRLENYLNSQISFYLIDSRSKAKLPILKKGDLALDFGKTPGLATLQQWDGKKLISIAIASTSIVGFINLLTQATGSGIDPTKYLKSDGANGWVLAPVPSDLDPAGSIVLAAVNLAAFDVVTIDGNKANSATLGHYGRVMGLATVAISSGFTGTVEIEGQITNGSWSWSPNDKLYLNGTTLSTTPPVTGFVQKIAVAKTSTTIIIELGPPVLL